LATSSGSVGIGTTGPASALHINSSSVQGALLVTNGSGSNYTALFVNATSGNVGIGTTAPQNILDVVGAVTVSKGLNASNLNVTGFSITDDSLITLSDGSKKKIKDIKAGEEVLTLDEKTGRIVSMKVNALRDHGVKLTYELTTKTGRAVNTTREHPYLAKLYEQELCDKYDDNVWNKEADEFNNGYCTRWVEVMDLGEDDYIAVPADKDNYIPILPNNISSASEGVITLSGKTLFNPLSPESILQSNLRAKATNDTSFECGAFSFASSTLPSN